MFRQGKRMEQITLPVLAHEKLDWINVLSSLADEYSGTEGAPATLSWMSSFLFGGGETSRACLFDQMSSFAYSLDSGLSTLKIGCLYLEQG